jgi:hypothetical protein
MLRSSRRARLGSVLTLLPLLFCSATVGAQVFSPQPQQAEPILDPASPMAELPDIGVAWPTMEANQNPSAQQVTPEKAQGEDGERRYSVELVGLEKIAAAAIFDRFAALSALKLGEGKPANTAQIDRRAREVGICSNRFCAPLVITTRKSMQKSKMAEKISCWCDFLSRPGRFIVFKT